MINIQDLFKGLQESGFGGVNRGGVGRGGNVPNIGGGIGVGYMPLPSDPTFSSGNRYAQSIAGGQNVENMIAPGMSFSAANPQGYTQANVPTPNPGTPPDSGFIPPPPTFRDPTRPPRDDFISIGGPGGNDGMGDPRIDGGFMPQLGFNPGGYQGFDFSGFQKLLDNLPAQKVDANDYKDDIMKIVNDNFTIPSFDDTELRELIAGNTTGINSIPDFDPSTLNLPDFGNFATRDDLENRPIYDDTDIRNKITSIENLPDFDINDYRDNITSIARQGIDIPQFDDSAIRDMINNNSNMIGNIPQFDPSSINNQISGLQDQILNIPQFDASGLQNQIGGLQNQIGNIPQFDPSTLNLPDFNNFATRDDLENRPIYDDTALRDQITSIGQRPGFDDSALRSMIEANTNRPGFDASGLQSQIGGLQDQILNIPQFDDSGLRQMIEQNANRPGFDPSSINNQISGLQKQIGNIPQFDPSSLNLPDFNNFVTRGDLENRPIYDDTALRDQITSIEQRPTFDPTDLQSQISGLQNQFSNMPTYQAPNIDDLIARLDALENAKSPVLPPVIDDTSKKVTPIKRVGVV